MDGLSHGEWCQINEIITQIYNCKDLATLRGDFLERIEKLVPYQRAFFDLGDSKGDNHIFFDPIAVNMSNSDLDDYYRHFESLDYAVWALSQDTPIVYRDTDLLPDELRERSLFCNEWLKPMDVFYCGGTSIVEDKMLFGSVTLLKSKKSGDFSNRDLQILSILNDHLCRRFKQIYPNGISYKFANSAEDDIMSKYRLTQRECEILQLLNAGMHNNEISARLFISENTTKKHVAHIYEKLNVSSRSQLVRVICEK